MNSIFVVSVKLDNMLKNINTDFRKNLKKFIREIKYKEISDGYLLFTVIFDKIAEFLEVTSDNPDFKKKLSRVLHFLDDVFGMLISKIYTYKYEDFQRIVEPFNLYKKFNFFIRRRIKTDIYVLFNIFKLSYIKVRKLVTKKYNLTRAKFDKIANDINISEDKKVFEFGLNPAAVYSRIEKKIQQNIELLKKYCPKTEHLRQNIDIKEVGENENLDIYIRKVALPFSFKWKKYMYIIMLYIPSDSLYNMYVENGKVYIPYKDKLYTIEKISPYKLELIPV